jgi:hypothetical protein
MSKVVLLIIVFIVLIIFNFYVFSHKDKFYGYTTTVLTQNVYKPLELSSNDLKLIENINDNNINNEILSETKNNKVRLNSLMNIGEELFENVQKLIVKMKQNSKEKQTLENRIKQTEN